MFPSTHIAEMTRVTGLIEVETGGRKNEKNKQDYCNILQKLQ